jgi:type I restriction enzyme S subunit
MRKNIPSLTSLLLNRYGKYGTQIQEIENISNYLGKILSENESFLDENFLSRLVSNSEFDNRMAELYFISALRSNCFSLEHKSNEGLDIWINDISGWGEFVCAHNTPEMKKNSEVNEIRRVNNNDTLLRITTVLKSKSDIIKRNLAKGLIHENEPVVLFLSTSLLIDPFPMNPEGDVCSFARSLFPISEPVVYVNVNTGEGKMGRNYQYGIPKKDVIVENDFFLNETNSLISAVVFSYCSIFYRYDHPTSLFKDGDDFIIFHNPLAKNPIQHGLMKCWQEYVCEYEKDASFTIRNIKA